MTVTVKTSRYQRVEEEKEFTISEDPLYVFRTGIRKSFAIIPIYSTWMMMDKNLPEEIVSYDIIEVGISFENTIKKFRIDVHNIPSIMEGSNEVHQFLVGCIIGDEKVLKGAVRTSENFMTDFNYATGNFLNSLDKVK